jgi:hypothetical protein
MLHGACSEYQMQLVIEAEGLQPSLGFGIGQTSFIFIILLLLIAN